MKRLSDSKSLSLFDKVINKKLSVSEAARQLGITRKTVYKYLENYKPSRVVNSLPKSSSILDYSPEVLHVVVSSPNLGTRAISHELKSKGIDLCASSVWKILRSHSLSQRSDRDLFAQRHKASVCKYDSPRHTRLTAESRREMIEQVDVYGKSVKEVLKQFNVSRKTYSKWKRRYLEAKSCEESVVRHMCDHNPVGDAHHRSVDVSVVAEVLGVVQVNPQLSASKIAALVNGVGNHGVQNILQRNNLNTYMLRQEYADRQREAEESVAVPAQTGALDKVRFGLNRFVPNHAPAPPPVFSFLAKTFGASFIATIALALVGRYWIDLIVSAPSLSYGIGIFFATVSLAMGTLFLLYSFKYYITLALVLSFKEGDSNGEESEQSSFSKLLKNIFNSSKGEREHSAPGLQSNISDITLDSYPFVSVQIPFFNEKYVAERAIRAATNFEYKGDFEVIVCDDSTDETTNIVKQYLLNNSTNVTRIENKNEGWSLLSGEVRPGVTLKHLHRTSRSGFKGAALKLALTLVDDRTEFISIFDADFVPYPDSLDLFLKYFKAQNKGSENYASSNVAAVQGYQWHVLNKSENWITRGVRSEYSGSYVIERAGQEIYGGLKHISGSVYMIRRDVLEEVGWKSSITEDYELTLRLYEKGYRVVYTPYIQAPAECVSTLKRLIRQRMRWAEGHSFNVKIMWKRLLFGRWEYSDGRYRISEVRSQMSDVRTPSTGVWRPSPLTPAEKIEFLFNIPYYLQAFFFLVGTFSWLLAETVFQARLPFWTTLWGWSLVLTNMFALPLVNAIGLFLEESDERDYVGLMSFVALSYIVVPFQAYAAMKGFLEKEEGGWFRTPKTGVITDVFNRKFYSFLSNILHKRLKMSPVSSNNEYLKITSGNQRFNNFNILPSINTTVGNFVLAICIFVAIGLSVSGNSVKSGTLADLPVQARVERYGHETDVLADLKQIVSGEVVIASDEVSPIVLKGRPDVSLTKVVNIAIIISFIMVLGFLLVRRVRSVLVRKASEFTVTRQSL